MQSPVSMESAPELGCDSPQPISDRGTPSALTSSSVNFPRRAQFALVTLLLGVIGYGTLTVVPSNAVLTFLSASGSTLR